jgi:hypothetical protein
MDSQRISTLLAQTEALAKGLDSIQPVPPVKPKVTYERPEWIMYLCGKQIQYPDLFCQLELLKVPALDVPVPAWTEYLQSHIRDALGGGIIEHDVVVYKFCSKGPSKASHSYLPLVRVERPFPGINVVFHVVEVKNVSPADKDLLTEKVSWTFATPGEVLDSHTALRLRGDCIMARRFLSRKKKGLFF